jgi:hypothetical protein
MNDLRISTSQYEKALAEIIAIQSADTPINLGRLEELTEQIDSFERSVWTEDMFEGFDAVRLEV